MHTQFLSENLNGRDRVGKVEVNVQVKLSLCFLTEHHSMKAYWGVEV